MKHILSLALLILCMPVTANDTNLLNHKKGIWSIPGTDKTIRWVVIHDLENGNKSGVYHIEVIERNKENPVWQIKHLVKHMAITTEALTVSIGQPLNKGAVYPETFDDAHKHWKSLDFGRGGKVCKTSILACMGK